MALILRTSERREFKNCRQKWYWGYRENLVPIKEDRNLYFGTAMHRGWEIYYDPKTWHISREEILPLAIRAFQESFVFPGDIDEASEEEREDFYEYLQLGKDMLVNYAKWAQKVDHFKPVATEIKFEVPIPGIYYTGTKVLDYRSGVFGDPPKSNVFYQGKIDLLLEDKNGGFWIMDHKTTANLDVNLPDFLPMDDQVSSYCWALGYELGIKIEGFLYNEAVKSVPHLPHVNKNGSISQDKRQNTTYELYWKRIRELNLDPGPYQGFLSFLQEQPNKFFRRTQVQMSPRQLELVGERIATEAIDIFNDPSVYPNPARFLCGRCQYRSPCMAVMDGSDPSWIFDEYFKPREELSVLIGDSDE